MLISQRASLDPFKLLPDKGSHNILVAQCSNLSSETLLFGQMEHKVLIWLFPGLKKGDCAYIPPHSHFSRALEQPEKRSNFQMASHESDNQLKAFQRQFVKSKTSFDRFFKSPAKLFRRIIWSGWEYSLGNLPPVSRNLYCLIFFLSLS